MGYWRAGWETRNEGVSFPFGVGMEHSGLVGLGLSGKGFLSQPGPGNATHVRDPSTK